MKERMNLEEIKKRAVEGIEGATNAEELEAARTWSVGRNGELTKFLRSIAEMPLEERRKVGPAAGVLRSELEELVKRKKEELSEGGREKRFFDVTKPGAKLSSGHLHPLTQIDREVRQIFSSLNFSVLEGPEVESEHYNFDALNIPAGHPARDMWDTFWLQPITNNKKPITKSHRSSVSGCLLMRTHTSPMQIRYMERHEPPFQIIVPGRVFRYEATDASHEINFYQVEGLMVGPDVTLANFKFVIEAFFKKMFGENITFRFRPSYFPFVEPGVEVDVKIAGGKWLEVMGAGMVHRNVFDAVRYNPDEVQGFAFGVGLDRLAMIKYGIPDIRLFYSGDLRFTNQF